MATFESTIAAYTAKRKAAERRAADSRTMADKYIKGLEAAGIDRMSPEQERMAEDLLKKTRAATDEIKAADGAIAALTEAQADEAEIDRKSREVHPVNPGRPGDSYTANAMFGGQVSREGDNPAWVRSDGRNAVVGKNERFSDHPVVREEIEKYRSRDEHIIGTHGNLAGLMRSISTTSGASAMVPTDWAAQVIDKARNATVLFEAGATLVPMAAKVEQIARLTTDPAPTFRAEGATIPATDPAFDFVQLTATSLGTVVVASVELLQDAPNADQLVQDALSKAMALEIDKAGLYGQIVTAGNNEGYNLPAPYPKGILKNLLDNAAGQVLGGATNGTAQTPATPFNELLSLYYQVARQNEQVGAIISSPRLVQQYDGMYDTLYRPLSLPPRLMPVPWLTTNAIPSFTSGTMTSRATDAFAGDFSQVLIGQRLGLEIRTLTERYAELGQVAFLAFWRGDVQVARPTALACFRYLQGAL